MISCYNLAVKVDYRKQISPEQINKLLGTNYTKADFAQMEMKVVAALDFQLSFPTAHMFMTRFMEKVNATPEMRETANVLIEIALILYKFVDVLPSILAASAVAVSCAAIGDFQASQTILQDLCPIAEDKESLKSTMQEFINYGKEIIKSRTKIGDLAQVQNLISAMNFDFGVDQLLPPET